MQYIQIFIITFAALFLLQFLKRFKLPSYQYYEMTFGGFFIVLFFGLFGGIFLLNQTMTQKAALFATLFMIWYYCTKKLVNYLNTDANGVIYY